MMEYNVLVMKDAAIPMIGSMLYVINTDTIVPTTAILNRELSCESVLADWIDLVIIDPIKPCVMTKVTR
jgi:hypothetical protein